MPPIKRMAVAGNMADNSGSFAAIEQMVNIPSKPGPECIRLRIRQVADPMETPEIREKKGRMLGGAMKSIC